MPAGLVLLVEDEAPLRKLYTTYLESQGYSVLAFGSADAALQYTSGVIPKLILLDIMLPGIDGIETCRKMRQIFGSRVPILFLTALDDAETLERAFAAGGNDYVIKSHSLKPLRERVDYWSRADTRYLMEVRQNRALSEIRTYVRGSDDPPEPEPPQKTPAKENDAKRGGFSPEGETVLRMMAQIIMRASDGETGAFGDTGNRTWAVGYVSGVIDFFSATRPEVASRFRDFLSAVLTDTGMMPEEEVRDLLAGLDKMRADDAFQEAFRRARDDCRHQGAPTAAMAVERKQKKTAQRKRRKLLPM